MSDKREVRLIDANALLDAMPKSDVLLRHHVVDAICNSPSIDVAPVITGETSDGYHTFNELYHHRAVLFSVIVKAFPDHAWKSRKHHDGTMYDGMFIVGIETPDGQATYHYDINRTGICSSAKSLNMHLNGTDIRLRRQSHALENLNLCGMVGGFSAN